MATYETLAAIAATRKRVLYNNTRLVVEGEDSLKRPIYAIRLHNTNILYFRADGRIELNAGSWKTVTTKERFNRYLPNGWHVWSNAGVWYLGQGSFPWLSQATGRHGPFAFQNRITIHPDGTVTGEGEDPRATRKLRRDVQRFTKAYMLAFRAGKIPPPSNGDCWGCLMKAQDGSNPLGGKSHMLDHLAEKYFVPSMLVRAFEAFPLSTAARHNVAVVWANEPNATFLNSGGFIWTQIEKSLTRWCYREVGLAS